jgi:hypothetical protein
MLPKQPFYEIIATDPAPGGACWVGYVTSRQISGLVLAGYQVTLAHADEAELGGTIAQVLEAY